mgnify:FL=1
MRLVGTGATDDFYADNLSLRPAYAKRMPLPSWIDYPAAFEMLEQHWGSSVQDEAYMVSSQQYTEHNGRVVEDIGGATARLVEYDFAPDSRALLVVRGLSLYSELTTDSATTEADLDLVVSGACANMLRDVPEEKTRYERFAREFARRKARLPRRETWLPGLRGG